MKVKATVGFAGTITMAEDEVRDVREDVAVPLIQCGYLISVDEPAEVPSEAPADEPAKETTEAEEKPKKGKKPKEAE